MILKKINAFPELQLSARFLLFGLEYFSDHYSLAEEGMRGGGGEKEEAL